MKKTITLLAFAVAGLTASAQKQIEFKVDHKPASAYVQKMNMEMNLVLSQGGEEMLNQPLDMIMTYTVKTAKAASNGDVPFNAQMKMESDAIPTDQLNDNVFYGKFAAGKTVVDSVKVGGMQMPEDKVKEAFIKAINQFGTTTTKLKVGESFKVNQIPVDLGGLELGENTNVNITYTLKSVEGNKASFDLLMDTPLDITTQGINMKGKMKMTGTMTYLTDLKYVSGQVINMDASFNMAQQGVEMKMAITGTTNITTTVTPN